MKKIFKKKVRWDFRISMEGYGRNVKEALKNATQLFLERLENGEHDLEAIEEHEVVLILEDDEVQP
jgi:dsRNA-specific ribonuclease